MTIVDTIRQLQSAEDADTHFLIAATINLYSEAMWRKGARRILVAEDIPVILEMCANLLRLEGKDDASYAPKGADDIESAIGRRVSALRPQAATPAPINR